MTKVDFENRMKVAVRFSNLDMQDALRVTIPMIIVEGVAYTGEEDADVVITDHLDHVGQYLLQGRHVVHYCLGEPCGADDHPSSMRGDPFFHVVFHEGGVGATVFALVLQDIAKMIARARSTSA